MKKEFIIGISVIASLLILFFGINYLKGINMFKASNYYYVSYTDVAGLAQSAPVTVNGYKVGLVREIEYEYDNPGHIKVEISLDKKLKVPSGSKAILATDMLGTASIQLQMNTSQEYHKVGDKLIGENATGLMGSISGELLPSITTMLPKIDSLLTSITYITTNPALLNSIQRLDNIMANIETTTNQLNKIAPAMANDAKATMSNAKKISDNLSTISQDLTAVSSQLKNMPIEATVNNIQETAQSLNTLTKKINSNDSSIGMLLNDDALYNNLNNSAASLDSLLKDVKRNPKRYISIKLL